MLKCYSTSWYKEDITSREGCGMQYGKRDIGRQFRLTVGGERKGMRGADDRKESDCERGEGKDGNTQHQMKTGIMGRIR